MNHSYIEEHNLVERYVQGTLAADERARFEDHFFACKQCLESVEWAEDLQGALRDAVVEETARARVTAAVVEAGLLGWLARGGSFRRLAFAAVVLGIAVLPALLLLRHGGELRGELERARSTAAQWQDRYQETTRQAADLETRIAQLDETLESARAELDRRQPSPAPGPRINTRLFYLETLRGTPGAETVQRIVLAPGSAEAVALSMELGGEPEYPAYRATLTRADGRAVWREDGLRPDAYGAFVVVFPPGFLPPGDYHLKLHGLAPAASSAPAASYSFRIVARPASASSEKP